MKPASTNLKEIQNQSIQAFTIKKKYTEKNPCNQIAL